MKKLFIYFSEFLVRKNMLLIFVFLAFLTQHVRPYEKVIKIESNQVKIKCKFKCSNMNHKVEHSS